MQKKPTSLPFFGKASVLAVLFSFALCSPPPASAQLEEEMDILRMIYKDQDLVTPTRSPKPISQVAENITVIDADEIEAINAHTLADVLQHVTGVQIDIRGGPGSIANTFIQGSLTHNVRVIVDGVSLNNLSDSVTDIGSFPVQRIERIEIVKGPGSSAWGSSLGGIINIITKSPDPVRSLGGIASASIGERATGDYRLDLSGTTGSLGYYLSAGGMSSDGLNRGNHFDAGNLYTKLQWDPTRKARLQLSVSYDKGSRGEVDSLFPTLGQITVRDHFEYFYLVPSFSYNFTNTLDMELTGRFLTKRFRQTQSTSFGSQEFIFDDLNAGGSAKVNWRRGFSNLLVGADYDHGALETSEIKDGRQVQERWAIFANDTLAIGDFAVTPGVRYDHTSTSGGFWSPSLGVTYTLFDRTIFRVYAARGFNATTLLNTRGIIGNSDLKAEKVWSYSAGIETSAAGYFWLKATLFQHDIKDVIDTINAVNKGKQRRRGAEVEIRTVPLWSTSLMTGYAFIDASDRDNGRRIKDIPRYTWDVGVDYKNRDILNASLRGHYIWWNTTTDPDVPEFNGRYSTMIWDLNLSRRFYEKGDTALEAFFTAHNIFNGSQFILGIFQNPRRWFEGGIRCRF